jgi:hypothetical protein
MESIADNAFGQGTKRNGESQNEKDRTMDTFTKTFSDGLTVRINGSKIGTNCKNQSSWIDGEKIASFATALVRGNPLACDSADEFVALAVHQLRATWQGAQQLKTA